MEMFYGLVVGSSVQRSDRSSRRHNIVRVSPTRVHPQVPIHVFSGEVFSHQYRQSYTKTDGQIRSDQWAERRKLSRKGKHMFAGQYDLDGSTLQVVLTRNGK